MAGQGSTGSQRAPREATRRGLTTGDFDYPFDGRLIAQHPLPDRSASRLLVVDRATGGLEDRTFRDLPDLVSPEDVLVLNDTRVFPARLLGRKPTGAAGEIFLVRRLDASGRRWHALVRPGGKLKPGRRVEIGEALTVQIEASSEGGGRVVRLETPLEPDLAIARYGHVPLPPYIRRKDEPADRSRYQTVYAEHTGSVAAPTAGLHFTRELLAAIEARGTCVASVTLHVGPGTFRPVEVNDPSRHILEPEWYRVPVDTAGAIRRTRAEGGRVWAVGTTCVRTLEAVASRTGEVAAGEGWTDLFIRPPYEFRAVDRLLTNFHLPRSTLLMLVAAFAGYEVTLSAYRHAVDRRYRFYSYGDAMLVV